VHGDGLHVLGRQRLRGGVDDEAQRRVVPRDVLLDREGVQRAQPAAAAAAGAGGAGEAGESAAPRRAQQARRGRAWGSLVVMGDPLP